MKNFKGSLLSKNISQQEKILETMMNRAAKDMEEQPFYNWIQQLYTARVGTVSDADFAKDALWSDMAEHADSELFGELTAALL